MRNITLYLFLCWILPWTAAAQIKLEVTRHAPFPTKNERLFIAASFNNWDPGRLHYELKKESNGNFTILLPDSLTDFEYKITQGSWVLVEGNPDGSERENRHFIKSTDASPSLIQISIEGWEVKPTYRFVITALPENTPKDAAMYITGNFNNWNPGMEEYRLQKQVDETYRVSVISDLDKLEYKFTRGDWARVEGKRNGRALPNRVLVRASVQNMEHIPVEILSWEDFSATFNFFSLYDLLLLFSAFQCVLLIIAIPSMQDYNRRANYWLVISIGFIAIMVFIHVIGAYRDVAQSNTKLLLVPDFAMFIYAPLFYFYIRNLLFKSSILPKRWWIHFILPVVQLFFYLPYFLMEHKELQIRIVNNDQTMHFTFMVIGLAALVSNIYYWFLSWQAMKTYQQEYTSLASTEQNIQYLGAVMIIQAVCLGIWIFSGVLMLLHTFGHINTYDIRESSVDTIWLAFSCIPYFLGYFAIHQPEIFKIPNKETLSIFKSPISVHSPSVDSETQPETIQDTDLGHELIVWRGKIDMYMSKHQPYHNPGLTLGSLAGMLKIPSHQLSKIINEGYGKNFFDFINSYRIEDFKTQYEDPKNKHFTMLALAFEVGFNSKTAFNRAFKKMTGSTPREYFYDSRVED